MDGGCNHIATYHYDAWGNHKVLDANYNEITDTSHIGHINPIRYRGYYYDSETGLYYCNARYYDPTTGRFISADDISYLDPETINGLNLFSYCGNNPVMNVDPSGHAFFITLLISVGLSLAFELAEDLITDGQLGGDKDWLDYLGAGISGVIGALPGLNAFSKLGKFGKLVLDVSFSLASGIIDSAISGDMAENGFWSSIGSIALSTTVSMGVGKLARGISSVLKTSHVFNVQKKHIK